MTTILLLVCLGVLTACTTNADSTVSSDSVDFETLEPQGTGNSYYVSGTGNDTNDGSSTTKAFRTLQRAANETQPGDTVFIMNGTYTNSERESSILYIATSGSAGHWIRYRAYPGHTPKLKSFANNQAILIDAASYIVIEGLTLEGNNDNVTEAEALTQIQDTNGDGKLEAVPNPEYAGKGIDIVNYNFGDKIPHHIVIRGNIVSKFGGSGISGGTSDFILVEHNTVFETAWYSVYNESGLNFYQNRNLDSSYTGYRIIIRNNTSYKNRNAVPCFCNDFELATDGNGLIIDDSRHTQFGNPYPAYTGKFLISNNLFFDNGGRGINVYSSDNVTIVNNTSVGNSKDPQITDGEISVFNSGNVTAYNNLMVPLSNRPANRVMDSSNVLFDYNLTFGGTGFTGSVRNNLINVNPKFVNPAFANFKLQNSSPAIDKGTLRFAPKDDKDKNPRPLGNGVDIGAYEVR
jgi:parallel beta-helix repeat protein